MVFVRALGLLYPAACCTCGAPGEAFCSACRPPPGEMHAFRVGNLACRSAGSYAGTLRAAILACKRGRRDVAQALGLLLAQRLALAERGVAALVAVPTTPVRRRERGFDQGIEIARAASRASGIPVLAALRHSAGEPQRGKSRVERLHAGRRFACERVAVLAGLPVLLVDDVATTGATLRDCESALRQAGAEVRGAAVVAHARACDER